MNTDKFELVHEEVLITNDSENIVPYKDEVSYELFFDYDNAQYVCTKVDPANRFPLAPDTLIYSLDKKFNELTEDERGEILEKTIGLFSEEDEVQLSDIFLHGEHITLMSYFIGEQQYWTPEFEARRDEANNKAYRATIATLLDKPFTEIFEEFKTLVSKDYTRDFLEDKGLEIARLHLLTKKETRKLFQLITDKFKK